MAGSVVSNYRFTVFCEKADLSASKCCEASYDYSGAFTWYGESATDEVCTEGLCSTENVVSKKPLLDNYYKMYSKCLGLENRFLLGGGNPFTQFKGQGSDDLLCKEAPELSMSKNSTSEYELSASNGVSGANSDFAAAEGLCHFGVKTLTPGSSGYYQLNISQEYSANAHSFYLVDNNFLDQGLTDVSAIENL